MERITAKQLEFLVSRLNRLTGMPDKPYKKGDDGRCHAQIGCYHLSYAYGGVSLHRICNEEGGVSNPLGTGHIPKRDLYYRIHAFICGIESAKGG